MVAAALALTGIGLGVPLPFVGIAAVVALGALGAAYLGWSERMLGSYANDLRLSREGREPDGFVRVEVSSPVGLDGDVRRPTTPSPHARRRYPRAGRDNEGTTRDEGSGPGQL
jgi:hypothetical protein